MKNAIAKAYVERKQCHEDGQTLFGKSLINVQNEKWLSKTNVNVPDRIRNYCIKLRESEQLKVREKKRYEQELKNSFSDKNRFFKQVIRNTPDQVMNETTKKALMAIRDTNLDR